MKTYQEVKVVNYYKQSGPEGGGLIQTEALISPGKGRGKEPGKMQDKSTTKGVAPPQRHREVAVIKYPHQQSGPEGDGLVQIEALGIIGSYHASPSGRFLAAWGTSNPAEDRETFALLDGNHVLFTRRFTNGIPFAYTSDNGNCILVRYGPPDALKCTFRALNYLGELLIQHTFKALPYSAGMSPDGRFAVVQLANSDHSGDCNSISLFDLVERRLVFRVHNRPGWADAYQFDLQRGTIELGYLQHDRTGEKYHYDFSGRFLEESEWEKRHPTPQED